MVAIFEPSPPGQCIVHWLGDSSGAKEEEIEIEAEERVLVPDSEEGQSLGLLFPASRMRWKCTAGRLL